MFVGVSLVFCGALSAVAYSVKCIEHTELLRTMQSSTPEHGWEAMTLASARAPVGAQTVLNVI